MININIEQDLSTIIQTAAAVVTIISIIGGALFGIVKIIQSRKLKITAYYVSRGVFADRDVSLDELAQKFQIGTKVVNVYGKRGIGKSAFLRFFCDCMNHKIGRENLERKNHIKKIQKLKGKAFYFHLSGEGTRSIDDQIISQIPWLGSTLTDIANNLSHIIKRKKIFIVLDNVNNAGLSKEIEDIIDIFLTHSHNFRIVVGSIEKQPLLNIMDIHEFGYIELPTFNEDDIFDFAKRNSKSISSEYFKTILDFSDGLPIFVSLLLNNDVTVLSSITYDKDRMDNYLGRIIDDLDNSLCLIAQYIGFFSVTKPIFACHDLKEFDIELPPGCFEKLESCSLIEFDSKAQTIKMHELFRDYICRRFCSRTDIIQKIYGYYCKVGQVYEQIYYLIMIEDDARDQTIIRGIQKAIQEENFAFLLMVGEHYKRLYDWNPVVSNMSEETFLAVVHGYLEGLIGVGNYPAAREVIDKCKISARTPRTDLQFRFSMLTAKLYHLQNHYEESIAVYSILLADTQNNKAFEKYEAKCLWGIAHSYRHQGKELGQAIKFYDESIRAAKRLGRKSEIIMGMREKLTILMCRKQKIAARKLYRKIAVAVRDLPQDGYSGTRASFLKSKAQYLAVIEDNHYNLQYEILSKVLSDYKMQRKRLQYNLYFQIGEYFRRLNNLNSAKENFEIALSFSKKNLDHNLETLSQIALIICDICSNSLEPKSAEAIIVNCIETCQQFDLNTNKLLAEMLLAYVQGTYVDGSIVSGFIRLGYKSGINACCKMGSDSLHQLDLFLM